MRNNFYMAETTGGTSNSQEVPLLDLGSDGINYNPKFVTSEIFSSDDAAVEWARNIAISNGFKLVKSSWKRGELYLRCNRGERNRGKGRNLAQQHDFYSGTTTLFALPHPKSVGRHAPQN
ncbi:uncharacterized protein [Spinacia oleracea]|uniref:FAR1 domain-containing protein n=1 Tax=Spinacia oleracea TaxID=3562 RepID=A0ABM3RG79_SPIOL|nr:uncharacterized protein LOC130469378 [Spinacia oleracea]